MSNVPVSKLTPGVFGLSHGGGMAGTLIRDATGSWAGHAFGFVGNNEIVQGQPPKAGTASAASHSDAIWAWRMWDQLMAEEGWSADRVAHAQELASTRYKAEIGTNYDYPAYVAFALEVLHIRTAGQLSPAFQVGNERVCSALVADGLMAASVPLKFVASDGPGIVGSTEKAPIPARLVTPGMLLGLAQRLEWI